MTRLLKLLLAALITLSGGHVYEDSPLWVCDVMGNGICGPGHG